MKRSLFCMSGYIGAALIAAASGAQAQTTAPNPPVWIPYVPAAPGVLRIQPTPDSKSVRVSPGSPASPSIDPMPRMAPTPGVAPMPNLAPSPFQRPSQPMAPMPGVTSKRTPGSNWLPFGRRFVTPGTDLRRYFPLTPTPNLSSTTPRRDTMVADGDFLYILRGDTLVKIDKKTLKVVESATLPAQTAPALPNTSSIRGLRKWSDSSGTHFGIGPAF